MFAVFVLIFCVSGIILNHRDLAARYSVSRNLLPSSYHIDHYNNGVIKGTLPVGNDSLLAFGGIGVWLTDRDFSAFKDLNTGLPDGVDGRNIKNIVRTKDGSIWCAAQFDLYRFENGRWNAISLPGNSERLSDITLNADSTRCVVLTRSAIYEPAQLSGSPSFLRFEMKAPEGEQTKVTLFKTIWMLHSGELFGIIGKIIVDIIALFIIFLCLTGIVIFIVPYDIRRLIRKGKADEVKEKTSLLRWNFKWHDKVGYATIILTLLLAVTGMCLRPPLMVPFVLIKTSPLPGSSLDNDNKWHDKLRGIRWDKTNSNWLLSTSEGFVEVDSTLQGIPVKITGMPTPPVSPMGVNVFEQEEDGNWLIGSFSGLYRWNRKSGVIVDAKTGKPYDSSKRSFGLGNDLVSGYSRDLNHSREIMFDYSKGAPALPESGGLIEGQPMSLWNVALELHVGRCYSPFLGPISDLFVFIAGLLLTLVLISGLILTRRRKRKSIVKNNVQRKDSK